MNAKGYQVLIDSKYNDVYGFIKKSAVTVAEQYNPDAIKAIEDFFNTHPNKTISSSDLSHILAAHCKRCKLPRRERITETKHELNEYWKIFRGEAFSRSK